VKAQADLRLIVVCFDLRHQLVNVFHGFRVGFACDILHETNEIKKAHTHTHNISKISGNDRHSMSVEGLHGKRERERMQEQTKRAHSKIHSIPRDRRSRAARERVNHRHRRRKEVRRNHTMPTQTSTDS
jgi:hypothetical protein